jgi:Raf kinase inhibitor-like YbhB/YbcL family protein
MKLFCSALSSGKHIPTKYASKSVGGGQNVSLPLSWTEIPNGMKSFALSMVDRHPSAKGAVHWLIINMSANARGMVEGASGNSSRLPPGCLEIRNSFGDTGYTGPLISKGSAPHEYLMTLYALNVERLELGPISPFTAFESEVKKKILASASLVASFGQ